MIDMRVDEEDVIFNMTLTQLRVVAKDSEVSAYKRVQALELIKAMEQLFIPIFGLQEELK